MNARYILDMNKKIYINKYKINNIKFTLPRLKYKLY